MYPHKEIEKKWQEYWEKNQTFHTPQDNEREKQYIMNMFPYPSADGLHVGHPRSYTATDIMARYARMKGYDVLFPVGWDAFGLPAENFAIKKGIHPNETTQQSIQNFRKQVKSLGFSYDWGREIDTSSPEYYKWTQWLFLELYKKGLAYKAKAPVNWCEHDQTVLANEQVVGGTCERCKNPVIQKQLEQWFFKVTEYADELLSGLDSLDWPESIKIAQRNWIGKNEGAIIPFTIKDSEISIAVFTTRPDTVLGVNAIILAPEHPAIPTLHISNREEVDGYIQDSIRKSNLERTHLSKEKTGVCLQGVTALNPANDIELPVYIADYVLGSYGTGAIMSVPVHDERDAEFSTAMSLPSIDEPLVDIKEILPKINGKKTTTYRLRDWLVSRQRYWGAPIPIIYCDSCGTVPVPEIDLPVILPTDVDFRPTGESPLARSKEFHNVTCPTCNQPARRESDTMDTFVCSSWYYLRFLSPRNTSNAFEESQAQHWMPVDLYIGGAEHAVLHLMYARFITKVLRDKKFLSFDEPFLKLRNQGMILGEDGEKMSKSRGNVINPDTVIEEYGADSLRLYEMFLGPLNDAMPWSTQSIAGVRRFLDRVYGIYEHSQTEQSPEKETNQEIIRTLHKTIKKVTADIESLSFNTAISAMMVCSNTLHKSQQSGHIIGHDILQQFTILLSPFAPHTAEELWSWQGNKESITYATWPMHDESFIKEDTITLVVQINGKARAKLNVPSEINKDEAEHMASADPHIQKWIEEKEIESIVYVPGRLINIVLK